MEDKIEVGEYVRLNHGKIDRVKNNNYYMQQYIECEKGLYLRENIVKHSKNIFELLENEDIVTLEYYVRKYRKRIKRKIEIFKVIDFINFDNIYCDFLYDLNKQKFLDGKGFNVKIKGIVTKEQFKQIQYEV